MIDATNVPKDEVQRRVLDKMTEYEERSVFEQYAIFMGKSQLLELALKGLLARVSDVPFDSMERWTLGQTKSELERRGLRPDFIHFLKSVVSHRNSMAHEFLANMTISRSIASFSDRKIQGELSKALYELEHLILFFDWCEEHDAWLPAA
jgi:hypothetical protein